MPESLINSPQVIAVFDFDHTFIDRDSLLSFLYFTHGYVKTVLGMVPMLPDFIKFGIGSLSRQELKEKILARFFKGKSLTEMQAKAKEYAEVELDYFIKPEALKRLHWHQKNGHTCMLVSASVDLYLLPWAQRHKFDQVLASRLEISSEGKITGKLIGLNCWGEEKKRRLIEAAGPKENFVLYAYGDSEGDKALLNMADNPFYRKFV